MLESTPFQARGCEPPALVSGACHPPAVQVRSPELTNGSDYRGRWRPVSAGMTAGPQAERPQLAPKRDTADGTWHAYGSGTRARLLPELNGHAGGLVTLCACGRA